MEGIGRFFSFIFQKSIKEKNSKFCKRFQRSFLIVVPIITSIIPVYCQNSVLSIISILVLVLLLVITTSGTQDVIDKIEEETNSSLSKFKSTNERLKKEVAYFRNQNKYLRGLPSELLLLQKKILECNENKISTVEVLKFLSDNLFTSTLDYTELNKVDISVCIYVYDKDLKQVARLAVRTVRSLKPKISEFKNIENYNTSEKFYSKTIKDNKEVVTLLDKTEIQREFDKELDTLGITQEYSQYIGVAQDLSPQFKIYMEVTVFDNKHISETKKGLNDYINSVIIPEITVLKENELNNLDFYGK